MKHGHFLIVPVSMPTLGLKAFWGIVLNQSGRTSTAGNGRGRMPSSAGKQRNVSVIRFVWSIAHYRERIAAAIRNHTKFMPPCAPIPVFDQGVPRSAFADSES